MRKLWKKSSVIISFLAIVALALSGCSSGSDGAPGATGATGPAGTTGPAGPSGSNAQVAAFHGAAVVTAEDELQGAPDNPKYLADIAVTGVSANADGIATVTFTVKKAGVPVTTIPAGTSLRAGMFKLAPAGGSFNYNKWVSYFWTTQTAGTAAAGAIPWPKPATYKTTQATRETIDAAKLVNNGGGSYTYTFVQNLATATMPTPAINPTTTALVGYDRTLTHRVLVNMGGHAGPTGEATKDFVPSGAAITQTRNIVQTATCKNCHGPEFAGHGGDRVTVEGCVTCHSPDTYDAQSGESVEMAVMIHKIHAGGELASIPGPDGKVFDDPSTAVNEAADNGSYIIWGNSNTPHSWETTSFPAVLANCQACHTGSGLQNVDNWKTVPSRAACGSCHDTINWTTGANHAGGPFTTDSVCVQCHPATGGVSPIVTKHDFTKNDIRNIQEFDITLTTDTPSRGYYINGEKPVVTMVLKPRLTDAALGRTAGVAIDHTTVIQQQTTNNAAYIAALNAIVPGQGTYVPAEGCTPSADLLSCTNAANGKFTDASMYVTGPRGQRIPVLTYTARAKVTSLTAGPWDLSAGGAKLNVVVDSGTNAVGFDSINFGGDTNNISGNITLTLPAAGAALNALFANPAAATPTELAAWLNSDKTFKQRAIAYVDEGNLPSTTVPLPASKGKLSIRSRGLVKKDKFGNVVDTTAQPNIRIVTANSTGTLATIFATAPADAFGVAGGAPKVFKYLDPAQTDPKVTITAANIRYTLDPVDDLVPGTYVINLQFFDRGNAGATTYKTPSVAVATFQVKQAAAEKPIAANCDTCHWSYAASTAGAGFVLDYPRHNKIFNSQAVDQCGGCHMYKSGMNPSPDKLATPTALPTAATEWGTKPISRRVHAIHDGSALNNPINTVGHSDSVPGRDWRINYPMDIRNCESCHPASTTSGTWKTNPNRLACMGCHDSDAAAAHMELQTYDPTPLFPWSGDEQESCAACH